MLTWTEAELAAQFRRLDGRLDHHRLTRKHGFPRPLPGFRNPLVWSRAAVSAWADGQIAAAAPDDPDTDVQAAHAAQVESDRRYLDTLLHAGGRA